MRRPAPCRPRCGGYIRRARGVDGRRALQIESTAGKASWEVDSSRIVRPGGGGPRVGFWRGPRLAGSQLVLAHDPDSRRRRPAPTRLFFPVGYQAGAVKSRCREPKPRHGGTAARWQGNSTTVAVTRAGGLEGRRGAGGATGRGATGRATGRATGTRHRGAGFAHSAAAHVGGTWSVDSFRRGEQRWGVA
jgi:hypothetical protein